MFTFKRNQVIITVLVFMIAVAAYLNTKEPVSKIKPQLVETTENQLEEKDFFENYNSVIQELPPDGDNSAVAEGDMTQQAVDSSQVAVTSEGTDAQQAAVTNETIDPNGQVATKVEENGNESVEASQIVEPDAGLVAAQTVADKTSNAQSFTATITKKGMESSEEVAEANSNKNLEVSYFVEEKILREQSRAQQIDQLTQYVANENLDKESKSKAAASLLAIQERIEKESSAEALLRAKGFKEVYVRIDEDSVDVVINKADLTDSDIAQIEEIVNRKTGYSVGKIKITPLKGLSKDAQK